MPATLHRATRALAAAAAVLLLAGCSSAAAAPIRLTPSATPESVIEGLTYRTVDGQDLRLDACLPQSGADTGRPAMILLHGGGFVSGTRSEGGARTLCALIAERGVAAFSIDYRLVPDATYPGQVDDVRAAISWLRDADQVERFGIDPARIGLLGSSAGAILAQEVGTAGAGATDEGSRVRVVVSLSGVADFVPKGDELGTPSKELQQIVLDYLGCSSVQRCAPAAKASAIDAVDRTDPPMLLVNSRDEIVPAQQAQAMHAALDRASVTNELLIRDGDAHGFALLDSDVRTAIVDFLADHL